MLELQARPLVLLPGPLALSRCCKCVPADSRFQGEKPPKGSSSHLKAASVLTERKIRCKGRNVVHHRIIFIVKVENQCSFVLASTLKLLMYVSLL